MRESHVKRETSETSETRETRKTRETRETRETRVQFSHGVFFLLEQLLLSHGIKTS